MDKKTKTKRGRRRTEDRAKEQLKIQKDSYPEGSIMLFLCVLFCEADVLRHTHTHTHTPQRKQCV